MLLAIIPPHSHHLGYLLTPTTIARIRELLLAGSARAHTVRLVQHRDIQIRAVHLPIVCFLLDLDLYLWLHAIDH